MSEYVGVCKRRDIRGGTKACTDLYINSIKQLMEEPCDGSLTACIWKAQFSVQVFNADPDQITYDWTVKIADGSHGATTPDGHDKEEVTVWVQSKTNKIIEVTCVVSYNGETDTLTKEFETRNEL